MTQKPRDVIDRQTGVRRILRERVPKLVGGQRHTDRRGGALEHGAKTRDGVWATEPTGKHPPLRLLALTELFGRGWWQVQCACPSRATRLVGRQHCHRAIEVELFPRQAARFAGAAAGQGDERQQLAGSVRRDGLQHSSNSIGIDIARHTNGPGRLRLARHAVEPFVVVRPLTHRVGVLDPLADRPRGVLAAACVLPVLVRPAGALEVPGIHLQHVRRELLEPNVAGVLHPAACGELTAGAIPVPSLDESGDSRGRTGRPRAAGCKEVGSAPQGTGVIRTEVVLVVLVGHRVPRPSALCGAAANFGRTWHE